MGLDNILKITVDAILRPTQEEVSFWNQATQMAFGGAVQAGREVLEKTLSGYDEKGLEVIQKAAEFAYYSGYANLLSAFVTSRNIGETVTDYRMQREVSDMVIRRMLGGLTSHLNPYVADLISRGGREFESAVNLVVSGIISYLKNNGVKNSENLANAFMAYVGLFGNSLVKLYESLRRIYTPEGIKLKLSGLLDSLKEYNKYFMYDNIKETINNVLSKIKGKKEEGKRKKVAGKQKNYLKKNKKKKIKKN